jgi:hypothetical protein
MSAGIALSQHYAVEALRLFGGSRVSNEIREGQRLLAWLLTAWAAPVVSLPDIYQRGPNSIREATTARRAAKLLLEHGWLAPLPAGITVAGKSRRDAWLIVRG